LPCRPAQPVLRRLAANTRSAVPLLCPLARPRRRTRQSALRFCDVRIPDGRGPGTIGGTIVGRTVARVTVCTRV
jgi:hypothetical protein